MSKAKIFNLSEYGGDEYQPYRLSVTYSEKGELYQFSVETQDPFVIDEIKGDIENLPEQTDDFVKKYHTSRFIVKQLENIFDNTNSIYFNGKRFVLNEETLIDSVTGDFLLDLVEARYGAKTIEAAKAFLNRLYFNVDPYVREQILGWMSYVVGSQKANMVITDDGMLVAYKGVERGDQHPSIYLSHFSGTAYVNDIKQIGRIPQSVGDVVTMPREMVAADPDTPCSYGLHAGTWEYASSFGSYVMTVKIDPADIVSVPHDCNSQKIRVCKYEILDIVEGPLNNRVIWTSFDPEELLEDFYNSMDPDELETMTEAEIEDAFYKFSIDRFTDDELYSDFDDDEDDDEYEDYPDADEDCEEDYEDVPKKSVFDSYYQRYNFDS